MAKTDPHIVPDNNDDNEFATGFKGYSVEAHEEVRMKQHEMEEHARARYDWDEKLLAVISPSNPVVPLHHRMQSIDDIPSRNLSGVRLRLDP